MITALKPSPVIAGPFASDKEANEYIMVALKALRPCWERSDFTILPFMQCKGKV
jgi:hypothetical protein